MEVKLMPQPLITFGYRIIPFLFSQVWVACLAKSATGGFDIRLQNGTVPSEGRVEIYINGQWGTVCASKSWDLERASFFCRLLDYKGGAASVLRDPIFGQGSGPVMIDQLQCKDFTTSSFDHCDKVYFPKDCTNPGAALRCLERPYDYNDLSKSIRLVGGDSPFEGRVEINVNGVWGSICSRGWNTPNGNVICKQMGFGPAINTKTVSYGNGDGTVFLSNVKCNGEEKVVLECDHLEVMMAECEEEGKRDDVGVRCSHPSDPYPVRLRSFRGSTPQQGIVEINVNGIWGAICTSTWSEANSRVVCRGLGLGPPEGRAELPSLETGGNEYPYVYAPPVLDSVDCEGSEPSLAICSHSAWGNSSEGTSCVAEQIVSITCAEPVTKDFTIRLHNASSSYDGHVEVYYENQWGAVCSTDWSIEDATVACRQIGLGTPGNVYTTAVNEEMIPPVVDSVKCTGDEIALEECYHTGFGRRSCNDEEVAAITCTKPEAQAGGLGMLPVRLVAGADALEGRVEIKYNSTWGSVCDTNWDKDEGDVVCRQLGYGNASEALDASFFEPVTEERTVKMWLDNIDCTGSEVMLAACSHSQWGKTNCGAEQEAGVRCMKSAAATHSTIILVGLVLACWTIFHIVT